MNRIEELTALLEQITPGPWRAVIDDDGNPLSGRPGVSAVEEHDCMIVHWDGFAQEYWRSARANREILYNASFIAAAPDAVRDMLEVVKAAKAYQHAMSGFAEEVRQDTGKPYPWEPGDIAEEALIKALEKFNG